MTEEYRLTEMDARYPGEDAEDNSIWGTPVHYLSSRERQAYMIEFRQGKIYDAAGALLAASIIQTWRVASRWRRQAK